MKLSIAMLLAAVSGFVSLSYEILFYRTISIGLAGAAIAFPLLLGAFLLGIALGARASGDLCKDNTESTIGPLRAIAGFVVGSNVLAFIAMPGIAWISGLGESVGIGLLFVMLASGLLGAQFPLIAHYGVEPDERAGQRVSYLYFANIVGSTLGSFVTGVWVLDHMSLSVTSVVLCVIGTAAGVALYLSTKPERPRASASVVVLLVVAAAVIGGRPTLFAQFWERLTFQSEYPLGTFTRVVENRHGVITIDQYDRIYGGGIYDGKFNTHLGVDNLLERAYAVGLYHPAPKRVLMVGLSSASWAEVIANAPGVEELVVVEINPGYLEILNEREDRKAFMSDQKVKIVIDDGRRWLMRNPHEMFDAVVSNHSYHWRNLASNLLSVEFNNLLKEHMNPGAVYIYNTTGEPRVYRTAFESWKHVYRLQNAAVVTDSDEPPAFERWKHQLANWKMYGTPVLEGDEAARLAAAQKIVDDLFVNDTSPTITDESDLIEDAWEDEAELKARVGHLRPITDDNMGTEWEYLRR